MAITTFHGIFIMEYVDPASEKANQYLTMNSRAEMLQDLGKLTDRCISTVSIDMRHHKMTVSKPQITNYGFHFNVFVSAEDSSIMHELKFCFKQVAAHVRGRIQKSSTLVEKLKSLAIKLTVLQNFENQTNLVHHKLDNQEWGQFGVMLWTQAQKSCLDQGRLAFQDDARPLRLIIRGCQGSGKTLLLMRLAEEYVSSQKHGLFLICIGFWHHQLKSELLECVKKKTHMAGRVLIGDCLMKEDQDEPTLLFEMVNGEDETESIYQPINISSVGAICYDEA